MKRLRDRLLEWIHSPHTEIIRALMRQGEISQDEYVLKWNKVHFWAFVAPRIRRGENHEPV